MNPMWRRRNVVLAALVKSAVKTRALRAHLALQAFSKTLLYPKNAAPAQLIHGTISKEGVPRATVNNAPLAPPPLQRLRLLTRVSAALASIVPQTETYAWHARRAQNVLMPNCRAHFGLTSGARARLSQ